MSELESVFTALAAIDAEIWRTAQQLDDKARQYSLMAQRAAADAAREEGAGAAALRRAAMSFEAAARHCSQAAGSLVAAGREGQAFVERTIGQSGGGAVGGLQSSRTGDSGWSTDALLGTAMQVQGGLAFFDSNDPTRWCAQRLGAFPGTRKYDLHGSSESVLVAGQHLDASAFAGIVRADAGWEGQPVTLFSCNTGKAAVDGSCFAQSLADELGVPVVAPTELAWSNGEVMSTSGWVGADGNLHPTDPPDGEFRTFYPSSGSVKR